ncbi:unnamed protein product [Ceutorhynchus assimilis]|uniref:Uncharacterized protein n=1 Tax=Ceutorhynchus assimilis TaxID=467358 RepID=A0A9N9QKQ7_9CUCU|nr:unnamed protein product [Ceutorhynchus assimilis]
MECFLCGLIKQPTKELKTGYFPCDSCRNSICSECSDLSTSELRCLPLQKRVVKFHCRKCRNYDYVESLKNIITDKEIIIQDKNEIIKMLKEKIDALEHNMGNISGPTFADVLQKNRQSINKTIPQNIPDVIIKPRIPQDVQQTKNAITVNINPTELKIGIKKLKPTKSGAISIKCANKHEVDVLKAAAEEKLKDTYLIETTRMKKPRVKITNFNKDMTKEEITNSILQQNENLQDFNVTYIKNGKNGNKPIFGECSGLSFKHLLHLGKIYISWERYPVYEDLSVPRCFHC